MPPGWTRAAIFDSRAPVEAFWRKFNIDGSKQPLNFMERLMAYGVRMDAIRPGQPITFRVAALPDRKLTLAMDAQHHPEALLQVGSHTVKLAYVYLQVVEGGLLPSVPSLDIFGTDIASGKAIHEHLIQKLAAASAKCGVSSSFTPSPRFFWITNRAHATAAISSKGASQPATKGGI